MDIFLKVNYWFSKRPLKQSKRHEEQSNKDALVGFRVPTTEVVFDK